MTGKQVLAAVFFACQRSAVVNLFCTACNNRYCALCYCKSTVFIGYLIVVSYVALVLIEYLNAVLGIGIYRFAYLGLRSGSSIRSFMSLNKVFYSELITCERSAVIFFCSTSGRKRNRSLCNYKNSKLIAYLIVVSHLVFIFVNNLDASCKNSIVGLSCIGLRAVNCHTDLVERNKVFDCVLVARKRSTIVNFSIAACGNSDRTLCYSKSSKDVCYIIVFGDVIVVCIENDEATFRNSILGLTRIGLRSTHSQSERMNAENA